MKKFKYRLQTVLKVRTIESQEQSRIFALSQMAVSRCRTEIVELRRLQAVEMERVRELSRGGDFSQQVYTISVQYREELRRQELRKNHELKELIDKSEQERLKLVEKEKKKKGLEKLEERDRENFNEEQKKLELKDMDELASGLWSRSD